MYGELQETVKYYRALQILNIQFNFACKKAVIPVFFLSIYVGCLLCNFGTIHLYGIVKMPQYLIFPMITIACKMVAMATFPASARMSSESRVLLKQFRGKAPRNSVDARSLKACHHLVVKVGGFFEIKDETVVRLFEIIMDHTISLILSFA